MLSFETGRRDSLDEVLLERYIHHNHRDQGTDRGCHDQPVFHSILSVELADAKLNRFVFVRRQVD